MAEELAIGTRVRIRGDVTLWFELGLYSRALDSVLSLERWLVAWTGLEGIVTTEPEHHNASPEPADGVPRTWIAVAERPDSDVPTFRWPTPDLVVIGEPVDLHNNDAIEEWLND